MPHIHPYMLHNTISHDMLPDNVHEIVHFNHHYIIGIAAAVAIITDGHVAHF
jgi:hypothetical protein